MKQHQLSAAFPSMSDAEIEALAEDIRAHGLREPGVVYEGKVLDGWHRYQACTKAGVPFATVDFPEGHDPVAFVKSRNLHRRHLTESQRATAVVACSNWAPSGRQVGTGTHLEKTPAMTNEQMAREADVSPSTIKHAKTALTAGFGDAVRDGALTVREAAKLAREPAIVDDKVKAKRAEDGEVVRLREQVAELKVQNEELRENLAEATADNESMAKVFEADDKLAESVKEASKLRAEVRSLRQRVNGLMAEKNEAIRQARTWQRKAGVAAH
jgi:hypothetical protein